MLAGGRKDASFANVISAFGSPDLADHVGLSSAPLLKILAKTMPPTRCYSHQHEM